MQWYHWFGVVVVGLSLLALLIWGIVTALSGDTPNPPETTSIRFLRFDRPSTVDDDAWCTGTRYRVTYITNELESDPQPHVEVPPSVRETDPVFSLNLPSTINEVKWYRAEATDGFAVWHNHTANMLQVSEPGDPSKDQLQYVDRTNPCHRDNTPDAPPKPEPFGAFDGRWHAKAGEGGAPWCVPTKYRARYRRGGQVSAWSEESIEFRSDLYTNPGVRVEPREGFTVEWIASSTITLPAGNSGAQNFWFSLLGDEDVRIWLDLGKWWRPGSQSLTIPVRDLVLAWNQGDADPDMPLLRINPDGLLELQPFVSNRSPTVELDATDWPGWWEAMGFDRTQPTNVPVVASRPPSSDILFTGEEFIDTTNQCPAPDTPVFIGFGGRAGTDSEFAWCKPTHYKYAHLVNGVEVWQSPASEEVHDAVKTDPVLEIVEPPAGAIRWYRSQDGGRNFVDHTEHMRQTNAAVPGQFVDVANPCRTPYVPGAPDQPLPNGVFGDQMWNQEAGGGVAPWCKPTTYVARYRSDTFTGDWSVPSVSFQSTQFSVPSLRVEAEPGHTVEWGRQSPSMIELPCFMVGQACHQLDSVLVQGPQGSLFWRINFVPFFDDWGTPPDITMELSDFVKCWNTATSGGSNLGRLERLRNGKLALHLTAWQGPGTYQVVENKWWDAMGFPTTFTWAPLLEATLLPRGSSDADAIELIGTGETLADTDNPCT